MCLTTCSLTQSGLSSHRGNIETHDINQMLNDGNTCNGDTRGWIHIDHHEFHMHSHSSNAGGITAYHSSKADSPTAYQRAPESETGSMSELMCKEDSYTPGRTMLKVGDRIMCPQIYFATDSTRRAHAQPIPELTQLLKTKTSQPLSSSDITHIQNEELPTKSNMGDHTNSIGEYKMQHVRHNTNQHGRSQELPTSGTAVITKLGHHSKYPKWPPQ